MIKINPKFIPCCRKIYIVGGSIRDILLGRQPSDYDIAAPPPCEPLAHRIAEKAGTRALSLGKPGLPMYRIPAGEFNYDLTPIEGSNICEDLRKRDFTVNAMAWDIYNRELIDVLNGRSDLEEKKIRMVSENNLRQDPLRMLRAFRLSAELDFFIEPETMKAISSMPGLISLSAGERIRDEIMKILECSCSCHVIRQMSRAGLLETVFPELSSLKGCFQNGHHDSDVFEHSVSAFCRLEELIAGKKRLVKKELPGKSLAQPAWLKLSALLHDIGKPLCRTADEKGRIRFHGHETEGAEAAVKICRRLRMSNRQTSYIDFIVRNHLRPLHLFTSHKNGHLTRKGIARLFMKTGPAGIDLLFHSAADAHAKKYFQGRKAFENFCLHLVDFYLSELYPETEKPGLINGRDLMREFSLSPSPLLGEILAGVEEERLSGRLETRDQALEWVKNFLLRNNRS